MIKIDYRDAGHPVRANFAEGHNRYWQRLASPGNWLTGTERVAVAKEVRKASSCKLCIERKAALSPFHVDGTHDTASELTTTMVEVVHRVITDSARLTRSWFDGIIQQGLNVEEYIEIVGTVVHVLSIDDFCRGIGVALHELPEPFAGEVKRYRPVNIVESSDAAWVPMLSDIIESSPEADLWQGKMDGNVIRALSLVPDEVRSLLDLLKIHYLDNEEFMDLEKSPQGTLSRIETEVVAARVSAFNACFY
ncbi:MAG: hypothetical protein ACI9SC_001843 [Gammaproteobacteria bacterium]|jgi:hypothetical protein